LLCKRRDRVSSNRQLPTQQVPPRGEKQDEHALSERGFIELAIEHPSKLRADGKRGQATIPSLGRSELRPQPIGNSAGTAGASSGIGNTELALISPST
jgi:hypothetical protein